MVLDDEGISVMSLRPTVAVRFVRATPFRLVYGGSNAALGSMAQAMTSSLAIAKRVLSQPPASANGGASNGSGNNVKK